MSKYRVAILRGGLSDEYANSMHTGAYVLEHIDRDLFEPIDIIVAKNGEWLLDGRARLPEYVLHTVDIVFNALHGSYGEDGTVQRLFDRYAVPYTGSKAYASTIATSKVHTKQHLKHTDIKMPPHIQVSKDSTNDLSRVAEKITDMFGPQYIIKPVHAGSSVGTMSVKNPLLLKQALEDALSRFDEVMVEAKIPGREATCGTIERFRDKAVYVLPPTEVVLPPDADFLSYDVKKSKTASEFCPSRFDRNTKDEIERIATLVHKELGLSQYSRSDFIVADDGVYFLEVNSLPQLSVHSLFPKAFEAVGASHSDFITHVLTDALVTHRR